MKVDEYLGCLVLLVFITSVVVSSLQMAILYDVLHQLNPIEWKLILTSWILQH